ncbi:phage minor head protein [Streptomyces griseofuscus]|uniref:phage minor head protein n=1 Tax=Streptomyces griseofuscus TaxID=146922 RepID=UPI0033F03CB9
MADLHALLDQAEEDVAQEVSAVLTEVADEFAQQLADATELVAARFSVSRIARMFTDRMPRIVRRLLRVSETAAQQAADDTGGELPEEWNDLPGRYDDGRGLPPAMSSYVTTTEHLMRAVGDRLAEAARQELAAGVDAGDSIEQLRARLRERFAREGAQLGDAREERIARTEAGRAWNTATLGAARAVTGTDAPIVKQWISQRDDRVRHAHKEANGQIRLLDEQFTVGGIPMDAPHDPTAPANQVVNCRCVLAVHPQVRASALESQDSPRGEVFDLKAMGRIVQDATRRAMSTTRADYELVPSGPETVTAAGGHTGAMIALVPSDADLARLAVDGGEPAEELHCTLYFLGKADAFPAHQQASLIDLLRQELQDRGLGPVPGRIFGVNRWNGNGDEPCWVWAVSDDTGDDRPEASPYLHEVRNVAGYAIRQSELDDEQVPAQHSPWVAHVTAAYGDGDLLAELEDRLGAVTFDRVRVAFAGEYTDIPLGPQQEEDTMPATAQADVMAEPITTRAWSTPGDTAIAFENEQTGDGRVFTPGSLYWDRDPKPLQYAEEMGMGHDGAELCGAINTVMRDGNRITAAGVLYLNRHTGQDAVMLLEQEAPLGVSVDLDDVDVEFVDKTLTPEDADWLFASAHLAEASVLRMEDGSIMLSGATRPEWTASTGGHIARNRFDLQVITGPGGVVNAATIRTAFARSGALTAAAGDPDNPDEGLVVHSEKSGDFLIRITKARLRGATLVAMPAYNRARIVLDPVQEAASAAPAVVLTAASETHERVVTYVCTSPVAVGAREVANALDISMQSARGHLGRAAKNGRIVRLAPGQYVGASDLPEGEVSAAVSGSTDLPVHEDREAKWEGDQARSRVLDWATDDQGNVDADKLGSAFLYRDPEGDPATADAYKLGYADVFDNGGSPRLEIVANGVYAAAGVLQGSMGGADIPEDEIPDLRDQADKLYAALAKAYKDDSIRPPWADETASLGLPPEIEASAWHALQQMPPMPAAWFQEPTVEELPDGSGGVHYKDGRVFGFVATMDEPHAGYPGKNLTVRKLSAQGLDLTHFLRAKRQLDDGTTVRVGAMTMNVGHHRDGAECETASCQFDDTRTVGAIVTVGLSSRGLWFSGAAAPWLSEWDRSVFAACQPSYHLKQGRDGKWQLRAVLTVPVPGHSTPLLAAMHAVAERAELALAASAAGLLPATDTVPGQDQDTARTASEPGPDNGVDLPGQRPDSVSGQPPAPTGDELAAALLTDSFVDRLLDAMAEREAARRAEIEALQASLAITPEEITASAATPKEND